MSIPAGEEAGLIGTTLPNTHCRPEGSAGQNEKREEWAAAPRAGACGRVIR
ncbi:MAG TPA: hypothetical protein VF099_07700 [Ktedonobacterales bacterium]